MDFTFFTIWTLLCAPVCALYATSLANQARVEGLSAPAVTPAIAALFALAALVAVTAAVARGEPSMAALILMAALCYFAVFDLRFMVVPVWPVIGLTLAGIAMGLAEGVGLGLSRASAAALGWGAFSALDWAYRRVRGRSGLGAGDALIAALIGAWLSFEGLAWSVAFGGVAGVIGARLLRFSASAPLPFVPALTLGVALYLIAKGLLP